MLRNTPPDPHICGPNVLPTPPNVHICTNVAQPLLICAPIPQAVTTQPRPMHLSRNQIVPNSLHLHVSAAQHFLHWLTLFGLRKLDKLRTHLPPLIIAHQRVVLVKALK